jgi:predicted enzyme related to lactoylglutathione lyase
MTPPRNPVGWFELYVQDMSRAKAFYESVLGVKLEALPGPDLEMQAFPFDPVAPGSGGALVRYQGKASGDGGTLVYFSCEDCAVQASRAAQNGGRIFREKFSIGQYGFIALVYDTEGNMVGLHSMR